MALWGNQDSKTASGTITINGTTGAVAGTTTSFNTQAKVGNFIRVSGEDYLITSITDDTTATVKAAIPGASMTAVASTVAYTLSEKPTFLGKSNKATKSTEVYGVDTTEATAGGDNTISVTISTGGTRYLTDAPVVTIAGPTALTIPVASVDTTADTITVTTHKLLTGTKLTYANGGGTSITGLTTATAYYVIYVDANTFKLATSLANTQVGAVPLVGAAVSGTAGQFTCTSGTLAVGDRITIAGNPTITGTATGITAGTYKVSAVTGTSPAVTAFTLTTDVGGALTTTAGTLLTLTYTSIISPIDLTGTGNALQTFTGDTATATATSTGGAVTSIAVTNVGSAYISTPNVTVAKPPRIIPTGSITVATDTIAYTAHGLIANEAIKYSNGGGTSATGFTTATTYYVANAGLTANAFEVKSVSTTGTLAATVAVSGTAGQFTCGNSTLAASDRVTITGTNTGTATGITAGTYKVSAVTGTSPNVTGFTLQTEAGGALTTTAGTLLTLTYITETVIDITGTGNAAQFFEIQTADAATAVAALGGGSGSSRIGTGWVKQTIGTGGRAGRITYETLVAMKTISGDQADDLVLPDA